MSDGASCRTSVTRIQASARRRAMTRPAADGGEVAINPWAASPVRRRAAFCPQATIRRLVMDNVHPKVEEAIDTLNMQDGPTRRRLLKGTGLVSATAAASALLAACSSSSSASPSTSASASAASTVGNFPKTPPWQFWFVNHVYTNPFFVPTQYGFQDAAALLGLPTPKWGGSASTSSVSQMVSYLDTAISANADGIATTVISNTGFTGPVGKAMQAGIPVSATTPTGPSTPRVSPTSAPTGSATSARRCTPPASSSGSGSSPSSPPRARSVIFIATPGTGNIQPRYRRRGVDPDPGGLQGQRDRDRGGDERGAPGGEGLPARAQDLGQGRLRGGRGLDPVPRPGAGREASLSGKVPAGGFDLTPTR